MTQQQLELGGSTAPPAPRHCQHCQHAITGEAPARTGLCWVRRAPGSDRVSLRWNAGTAAGCDRFRDAESAA